MRKKLFWIIGILVVLIVALIGLKKAGVVNCHQFLELPVAVVPRIEHGVMTCCKDGF